MVRASAAARRPPHAWAEPSFWYGQWKRTGDAQWIEQVIAQAKAGNERAHALWFRAFGALPEPNDAMANMLRKASDTLRQPRPMKEKNKAAGQFKVIVSSLEAPGNLLAVQMELAAAGQLNPDITYVVESVPTPDPRDPVSPVPHPLWRYEGTLPAPALSPPSEDIRQRIAELARSEFDPAVNWAAASLLALEFGPEAPHDRSLEILACMVHPPALSPNVHALAWLPRVQLAVAQVLAQLDTGWEGSRRRELLLSALFGPSDWSTSAAIHALAWIGENEPTHALDIHQCFQQLEQSGPDAGYCCWIGTLYRCWQDLPLLSEQEREDLKQKLAQLDD